MFFIILIVSIEYNSSFINRLTPKSDQHLISPYNITSESKSKSREEWKWSSTKEALDFEINSHCEYLGKFMENRVENISIDFKVIRVKNRDDGNE